MPFRSPGGAERRVEGAADCADTSMTRCPDWQLAGDAVISPESLTRRP